MTLRVLVTAMVVLVLSIVWLSSWRYRNWRGTGFTLLAALAFVLAGLLPFAVSPWAQAATLGAALWVLLLRSDLLGVMREPEYEYVERYVDILLAVGRLKRIPLAESGTYLKRFEDLIAALQELAAPDEEWDALQAETVRELRRRLTRMQLMVRASSEEQWANDAHWLVLEQRFHQLLKARAGFWRGFPHLVPRAQA